MKLAERATQLLDEGRTECADTMKRMERAIHLVLAMDADGRGPLNLDPMARKQLREAIGLEAPVKHPAGEPLRPGCCHTHWDIPQ